MTNEEKLHAFSQLAIQYFAGDGQMKICTSWLELKEEGIGFVEICPESESNFKFNVVELMGLFENMISCHASNHIIVKEDDVCRTPNLRMMGMFRGVLILFDLHLEVTDLEKC